MGNVDLDRLMRSLDDINNRGTIGMQGTVFSQFVGQVNQFVSDYMEAEKIISEAKQVDRIARGRATTDEEIQQQNEAKLVVQEAKAAERVRDKRRDILRQLQRDVEVMRSAINRVL